MEHIKHPLLKIALLASVIGALMVPLSSCRTLGTPDAGPGPVPIVGGIVDCAEPSLWSVLTFANLVPIVEHAIAQKDGYGAINALLTSYSEAEVSCVAAYLNDLGTKQAIDAPANPVVKNRVSVTGRWVQHEADKGVRLTNYAGGAQ